MTPAERLRDYAVRLATAMRISLDGLDARVDPCDVPGRPAWHATVQCGGRCPGLWLTARGFGAVGGGATADAAVEEALVLLSDLVRITVDESKRWHAVLAGGAT